MKVAVCTPWIDANCRWRERSRDYTAAFWASLGVPVSYGHSTARPVNRAQARNNASHGIVADVLFFADSDMWIPKEQFWAAVELAHSSGRMVLAYVDHLRLNKHSTERTLNGNPTYQGQTVKGCSGGCFAVPFDLLQEVGGHDERFEGWGGEDRSFQFACDVLAGPGERIPGKSLHLWHPRGADQSKTTMERRRGIALAMRYKVAAGIKTRAGILPPDKRAEVDVQAMRSILREPGAPLGQVPTPSLVP